MKTWHVEASFKVRAPEHIRARDVPILRTKLQRLANTYRPRENSPPLGELSFRFELDDQSNEIERVYAYYRNKHGKLARFMRLKRGH